jgi:hypothetical protein
VTRVYRAGRGAGRRSGARKLADVLPAWMVGWGADASRATKIKIKCRRCERVMDAPPRWRNKTPRYAGRCIVRDGLVVATCSCGRNPDAEPVETFFARLRRAQTAGDDLFI